MSLMCTTEPCTMGLCVYVFVQSEDESYAPNVYHQAMYYWSFQKGLEGFCYDGSQDDPDIIGSLSWVHRSDQRLMFPHIFGLCMWVWDNIRNK